MDNLYDYIYWRGDISFESVEINEIDMAIFSLLSYINFLPDMELKENGKRYSIDQLVKLMDENDILKLPKSTPASKVECMELLSLISDKNRYKDVEVFGYSYNFEKENAIQFAAVSFLLPNKEIIISYRGTDATLIGWKEDFLLSFQNSVGSQENGKLYLEQLSTLYNGPITLVGHSKGGNIALYSALTASKTIQNRIKRVFSFDGPGFNEKTSEDLKKSEIIDKLVTLVPQGSVIGILMQHEEPIEIVYSNKKTGITQHMPFSWEIKVDHFRRIEQRDNLSLLFDKSIRTWVEKLNETEMEIFINSVFDIIDSIGIVHVYDVKFKPIKKIYNLLIAYVKNDETTRKIIDKIIVALISSMKEVTVKEYKTKKEALVSQLKNNKIFKNFNNNSSLTDK